MKKALRELGKYLFTVGKDFVRGNLGMAKPYEILPQISALFGDTIIGGVLGANYSEEGIVVGYMFGMISGLTNSLIIAPYLHYKISNYLEKRRRKKGITETDEIVSKLKKKHVRRVSLKPCVKLMPEIGGVYNYVCLEIRGSNSKGKIVKIEKELGDKVSVPGVFGSTIESAEKLAQEEVEKLSKELYKNGFLVEKEKFEEIWV